MRNKILIVEDDNTLRNEICAILNMEGFLIAEADNGESAIEIASTFLPDLILCDIMMPRMDGLQVLSKLREAPSSMLTPFIFITALAERENIRLGMALGADDYLIKPFTRTEMLQTIHTRLSKSEVLRRHMDSEMDELREQIMTSVPHEMRTPLHAIIGLSTIINEEAIKGDQSRIADLSDYIHRSGMQLLGLINKFTQYLELRIEKPRPVVSEALSAPAEIIEKVISRLAKQYCRESDIKTDISNASVRIPQDMLETLLTEIIDNAFKFSKPGTDIFVKAYQEVDYYRIVIQDHGIGMRQADLDRIGAFGQFDRNVIEQQGSGLGLINSKLIAERYSGKFSILSEPQSGTKVNILVPLS